MFDGGRHDRIQKSAFFNKLKTKSAFFSNSVTYGPHTIVAMHAVFSGTYGTRTGTNSYWSTFNFKKDRFKTLTEYLKDQNYYTYADLLNKLIVPKQGFDEYVVHDEKKDDLISRHKDVLQNIMSMSNNKNFFLYLHYSKIHTGIMDEVLKVYDNFSKEYFDNKEENEKRYGNLFHGAEIYLTEILNIIKELHFDKNSLIVVMSDHGISTGEKVGERAYGAYCYDYTLRTFTYFMATDFEPIEISQQVRTIDFMPTILDYLQIPLDDRFEPIDGVSLLPLIKGRQIPEQIAYSETGNPLQNKEPPKQPNVMSVRTSKWKLIFNEYNNTKELYDLEKDPNEEKNLIGQGLEIEKTLWEELEKIISSKWI